jgi:hypothetical protein
MLNLEPQNLKLYLIRRVVFLGTGSGQGQISGLPSQAKFRTVSWNHFVSFFIFIYNYKPFCVFDLVLVYICIFFTLWHFPLATRFQATNLHKFGLVWKVLACRVTLEYFWPKGLIIRFFIVTCFLFRFFISFPCFCAFEMSWKFYFFIQNV